MSKPSNSEISQKEIRLKRWQVIVAAAVGAFTAIGTIASLVFSTLDYGLDKTLAELAEAEAAYKLARLEYEVTIDCNQGADYMVERILVTNKGNARAENVQIVLRDTGVEVLGAHSRAPHDAVIPRVYTQTVPMVVAIPSIKLDPDEIYEMEIQLAKYGAMDLNRITQVFSIQREGLEVTTSTRQPGSQGDLKPVTGIPQLLTHVVTDTDTIDSIALRYGRNKDTLLLHNPSLMENSLQSGQSLVIQPATCGEPSWASSIQSAHLEIIGHHVVRRGESLFCIARAYNVDPWTLAEFNGLGPPFRLNVGQTITVPRAPAKLPADRLPTCPRQDVTLQPGCRLHHVLQANQSLHDVAALYKVDLLSLAARNEIYTTQVLTTDLQLCIPE